jgi:DNA-binding response OmpR family regulator
LQATPKALVATTDVSLSRVVNSALEQEHFSTATAHDDSELLESVHGEKPDLLILDADLPDSGGLEMCRELRENSSTADIPIIMITEEENSAGKVEALEMGADDCVSKPLQLDELIARIKAVRRRTSADAPSGRLRAGGIDMDLDRWIVKVEGTVVELTKMEFRLLQALLEAKGRALSRDFLLEKAWAHGVIHGLDTRTVDVHIGRLRRKLGSAGRYIITVRNVGFRFEILPEWFAGRGGHS